MSKNIENNILLTILSCSYFWFSKHGIFISPVASPRAVTCFSPAFTWFSHWLSVTSSPCSSEGSTPASSSSIRTSSLISTPSWSCPWIPAQVSRYEALILSLLETTWPMQCLSVLLRVLYGPLHLYLAIVFRAAFFWSLFLFHGVVFFINIFRIIIVFKVIFGFITIKLRYRV